MPVHVDAMNSKWLDTTKRVFRTSYYIAKNDRPLSDHEGLVDLQIPEWARYGDWIAHAILYNCNN